MSLPALQYPNGISYEEFLATVDEGTHAEWVDGQVVPMSPASERHEEISGFLYTLIRGYLRRKGIRGRTFHGTFQMKLGPTLPGREPDVIYVAPEHAHRVHGTFMKGPADLAVEVISPESRTRDRIDKFREYQQAGVLEYWLIDPNLRTAEAYRLSDAGTYQLVDLGDPPRLRSVALPGFWVEVEWLWLDEPDEWVAYKAWGLI